jgi:hypothetical protein
MRKLRYLFATALVLGLTSMAKAAPPPPPPGFQVVVVDPTVPLDVIQPVYTDDFAFTFPTAPPAAGCGAPGQLPSGVPDPGEFVDCFTGINLTGAALTSLEIELPTASLGGATPNCPSLQGEGGDFIDVSCSIVGGDYLFDFSGGDIPTATPFNSFCYFDPFWSGDVACYSPAIFTIAIGNEPGSAPIITEDVIQDIDTNGIAAVANVTVTPEPSSILLMSTGVLSLGLFAAYRRRQNLVAVPPARLR